MTPPEASAPAERPAVSVIMANYNGAAFLAEAMASVQRQSLRNIELIVSDDASSDHSVEIVKAAIVCDPRIRLITSERNGGPGVARNKALCRAQGEWIAVMDSDDLIHPERLARLTKLGIRDNADIVADDLLLFEAKRQRPPRALLAGRWARAPFWVEIADYVRLNRFHGERVALGFLKPLFRASALARSAARYDETLSVAEDYHFVLRLLDFGRRMRVYPLLLYFYRKHTNSISYRFKGRSLRALREADRRFLESRKTHSPTLDAALAARARAIETALHFEQLIEVMRARDWSGAAAIALTKPGTLALLRFPLMGRIGRLRRRSQVEGPERLQVCVVSRQRVVGRTNGSSTYLLELAAALASAGAQMHFLSPSPTTLGRWPFLRLADDLSMFRSYRVRGTWRWGKFLISTDPWRYVAGTLAAFERLLVKARVAARPFLQRAPYSIAEPLTRADRLYLARYLPHLGDRLVADYCFLTEALPYVLRPDATTAVIMHDRFSSRGQQFSALASRDSVTGLDEDEECGHLALADVIIAIQREEREWVAARLPDREVLVAPMAAHAIGTPRPGRGDRLLFVGSSAAPNVDGLAWFFEACWPLIRRSCPEVVLKVAGSVCGAFGRPPEAVELLGFVDDLEPIYDEAGIVLSPLRVGSGLKIKLIEALGHGKAVVATPKTLQGVEDVLAEAVRVEDQAEGFAAAVIELLADEEARSQLAERAAAALRRHFSPQSCYDAFVERILGPAHKAASPSSPGEASASGRHLQATRP